MTNVPTKSSAGIPSRIHLSGRGMTIGERSTFRASIQFPSDQSPPHNGPAFNGRPGAAPRWIHKDRSARAVRCNLWLAPAGSPENRAEASYGGFFAIHEIVEDCAVQACHLEG